MANDELERIGLDTEWHGYLFRSQLEARWAMYLTALGMDWDYEPIGVELDDGTRYRPDFLVYGVRLPQGHSARDGGRTVDLFVEVKGRMDALSMRKVQGFSAHAPILVAMDVPYAYDEGGRGWYRRMMAACHRYPFPYSFRYIDGTGYGAFLGVDTCGEPALFGEVHAYRRDAHPWAMHAALQAAKQARFDHGADPDDALGYREALMAVDDARKGITAC